MTRLSSHVAADVLTARPATFLRVLGLGRLVIAWNTRTLVPDRKPGQP